MMCAGKQCRNFLRHDLHVFVDGERGKAVAMLPQPKPPINNVL
jgi:hypothetical protein